MKKLLSVLLVSVLLIGCSENRVLIDQLTDKQGEYDHWQESSPIYYYEDGLFNGVGYSVYWEDRLKREIKYKEGKAGNGWEKYWYENGQLKAERKYKNYEKIGLWKEWYSNGQQNIEGRFKNNRRDGIWKKWDKNGKVIHEGYYKNGTLYKRNDDGVFYFQGCDCAPGKFPSDTEVGMDRVVINETY